jgi:hypothetical protein
MGYYTNYEIEHDGGNKVDEYINNDNDYNYAIGESRQSCKWYNHDKDMISLSKYFPEVTFILSGEGEEMPDLWKTKYKNGKLSHVEAIITYPKFEF